ncbi:hypothetical protein SteCoe_27518 [Stentor coeruleus]|uniref:SMP-30/Gluconolactonase/LRE-like region domain-containing protein n=1 Tax=Stentor coeruleus TaxID=5963 RepID=A0A1R2BAE8_9CILI|nr:hypothetical protein SteCoe_27518 [Stentor coeruleus]
MRPLTVFGILTTLITSAFIGSFIRSFDVLKDYNFFNDKECQRVEIKMPSEDLAVFGKYIIGSTADGISMYYKHLSAEKAPAGYLISIDTTTQKVEKIVVENFPSKYNMNAHGITIFNKNQLYVLSHSYNKGGEIVFVFELEEQDARVQATFVKAIKISDEYGAYNSIALYDENNFYLTQWIPFPDTVYGRDMSFFTNMKRSLLFSYTKTNSVKHCTVKEDLVTCVEKAHGYVPNGILINGKTLFFADSLAKTVEVFNIEENFDLSQITTVPISHCVDNLSYKDGVVYVTGISKIFDYIKYGEAVSHGQEPIFVPGGFSKIYKEGNEWVSKEMLMQDKISLPSATVVHDKNIVISSIIDPAILFCPLVK